MDVVALIPAYEPDARLVDYAADLAGHGFRRIVVVDDGSGDAFRPIFEALESKPFCSVLRHSANRGKGAALKTGLAFIRGSIPEAGGVVTADSDGQHAPADCRRLADALAARPDCLHLGSRDFSSPGVPFRSRFGNRWSSVTFWMLHGIWLPDSQTGLRAFPASMVPMMLAVEGERFEYEMGVLMEAAHSGVAMEPVPIQTIYENGNAGTHYRPFADTVRINRLVFLEFFRFAGVSLASFALDQGLAWAFAAALGLMGADRHGVIWASGFAARLVSAVFNYSMNRTFVFRSNGAVARSAWKYAALCVAVIALSNAGVSGLALLHVPRGVAKLVCDVALCLAGYRVQAALIFK